MNLTLEEKQEVLWRQGIFLDNYVTEDIRINCYAIDKFFVDVVYDGEQKTTLLEFMQTVSFLL